MKFLNSAVMKWAARSHLIGLGAVLAHGANQGALLAPFEHTWIAIMFNPFVVGAAIGLAGVAKYQEKLNAQIKEEASYTVSNRGEDDRSEFNDTDEDIFETFETKDFDIIAYELSGDI